MLKQAISEVGAEEVRLEDDLRRIAKDVKAAHKSQLTQTTKQLLLSSRSKRTALAGIQRKRMALEKQRDTLESCELNEKVLSSMKKTSGVLKDIGMEAQLQDLDETILDLQEGTQNASMISSSLGENIGGVDADDEALQEELNALLQDEYQPTPLQAPVTKNKLSDKTEAEVKPQAVVEETPDLSGTEESTVVGEKALTAAEEDAGAMVAT